MTEQTRGEAQAQFFASRTPERDSAEIMHSMCTDPCGPDCTTPEPSGAMSMIELIKAHGLAKYNHGGALHSGATVRVISDYMIEADALEAEIVRRLELINRYCGTEASNIKATLQTGRPLDGWLRDESEVARESEGSLCSTCGHPIELNPRYDGDPSRHPKYRHVDREALIKAGVRVHRAVMAS